MTPHPHLLYLDVDLFYSGRKHLNDVLAALRTTHAMISESLQALNCDGNDCADPRVIWKVTNIYSQAAVQLDSSMREVRKNLRETISAGDLPTVPPKLVDIQKPFWFFGRSKSTTVSIQERLLRKKNLSDKCHSLKNDEDHTVSSSTRDSTILKNETPQAVTKTSSTSAQGEIGQSLSDSKNTGEEGVKKTTIEKL
uniref:Uncharacterized protein n=1 Tax=Parascaris univalens TaxID=6257 RepID=A0A915AY79_PARUN